MVFARSLARRIGSLSEKAWGFPGLQLSDIPEESGGHVGLARRCPCYSDIATKKCVVFRLFRKEFVNFPSVPREDERASACSSKPYIGLGAGLFGPPAFCPGSAHEVSNLYEIGQVPVGLFCRQGKDI